VKESLVLAMEGALEGGDLNTAEEVLAQIKALPSARRPRFLNAHALRFEARLADRGGDVDGVNERYQEASRLFREMRLPFWLGVTLVEHSEWLNSQRRLDDLGPLLAEAGEIFERLGAAPWLRRLATIDGRPSIALSEEPLLQRATIRAS